MDGERCFRADLTPAQAAWNTQRRKDLYEMLHPETVNGVNQHTRVRQFGEPSSDRFTAETAERTGRSERAVQRDAERGKKLGDLVHRRKCVNIRHVPERTAHVAI